MINFHNLFGKKKENAFLRKLKNLLKSNKQINTLTKAIFIGGFPVNALIQEKAIDFIQKDDVNSLLNLLNYDVTKDSLEFFYVTDISQNSFIVIILSPVELYSPDRIIDLIPIKEKVWQYVKGERIL